VLLPDAHYRVDDEDQQDDSGFHKGFHPVVDLLEEGQDKAQHGGKQQNLNELVIELFQDQRPHGGSLFLFQFVGSVFLSEGDDIALGEALLEGDIVLLQDFCDACFVRRGHGNVVVVMMVVPLSILNVVSFLVQVRNDNDNDNDNDC